MVLNWSVKTLQLNKIDVICIVLYLLNKRRFNQIEMYKVYINEKPLIICNDTDTETLLQIYTGKKILRSRYMGKTKVLLQHIDMMEKAQHHDVVIIESKDFETLKTDLKELFKIVKASGGVVENELGELLFIFRRGFWDLPKGKIDEGESKKDAAVREVEEETGIQNIELGKKLIVTKHMYRTRQGKRAIKKSYWYKMKATKQTLTPQLEEDILKAEWLKIADVLKKEEAIYQSINDVLSAYQA